MSLLIQLTTFFAIFGYYLSEISNFQFFNFFDDLLFLCIIILMALVSLMKLTKKTQSLYILLFFVCYFVSMSFSFLNNSYEYDIFLVQMRSYLFPAIFLVLVFGFKLKTIKNDKFSNFFLICCIFLAIGSISEWVFGFRILHQENADGRSLDFSQTQRSASFIGNPIDLGNVLCVGLLCLLSSVILNGDRGNNRRNIIIMIVLFLGIVATQSRAPQLAGAVTVIALMSFWIKGFGFRLFVSGFMMAGLFSLMFERNISMINAIEVNERLTFFLASLNIFQENFFIGVGPGRYGGWVSINYHMSPVYESYGLTLFGASSIDMFWPHFVVEIGLIGFLFWLSFIAFVLKAIQLGQSGRRFNSSFYLNVFVLGMFSISLETNALAITLVFLLASLLSPRKYG